MPLTQFLQQLTKLLRLCSAQRSLKLILHRILELVRYVGRFLDRMRRRPPCDPKIPLSPDSRTITCYSQVPAPRAISIFPDLDVPEIGSASNTPSSGSNSEYLHPYSGFARRPYAHSEPAMSLHRVPSCDPPRSSSPTRESSSSRPPSPTRSIHPPHVNTGVATVKMQVQTSEGVLARVKSPEQDQSDPIPVRSVSPGHPRVYTIVETNRYERYVKMFVHLLPSLRSRYL